LVHSFKPGHTSTLQKVADAVCDFVKSRKWEYLRSAGQGVVRMVRLCRPIVPPQPRQLRLFPEMFPPLWAVSELAKPAFERSYTTVDTTEESLGTAIIITGAKKPTEWSHRKLLEPLSRQAGGRWHGRIWRCYPTCLATRNNKPRGMRSARLWTISPGGTRYRAAITTWAGNVPR